MLEKKKNAGKPCGCREKPKIIPGGARRLSFVLFCTVMLLSNEQKKEVSKMKKYKIIAVLCAACLLLCAAGCGSGGNAPASEAPADTTSGGESVTASYSANSGGVLDTADVFTGRDLKQTADTSDAEDITVQSGKDVDITAEGVYVITGTAENCTVRVDADGSEKVQLVLSGVNIKNDSTPAIYVVNADKCFITTAEGTENTLSVSGKFTADGSTKTDAVIFAKDDIVLNGLGTLRVDSAMGNGVTGKDGVRITGGVYNVTAAGHGFEANDHIAVCGDADITVNADEDGLHAENDDDDALGWILLADGTLNISVGSDGIHANSVCQIDDGTITVKAGEGIEATYVQFNGGNVSIDAADDGVNAGWKSDAYDATVEITGGEISITVGQGDTDGIDSNGDVIISGGTVNITASMSAIDYDGKAVYTGGTIVINGEQVDSIPEPAMGGGPLGR